MRGSNRKIAFALACGGICAGALAGCISGDDNAAPGTDGGTPSVGDSSTPELNDSAIPVTDSTLPPNDAGPPEETSVPVDAGPGPAQIRFAWFVGGAATKGGGGSQGDLPLPMAPLPVDAATLQPGYDVCVAPHDTGVWSGPLLAQSALAGGLQPFDVTAYFPVAPRQYDARIVPAGSTSCSPADAGAPAAQDAGDASADGVDAGDAGPDDAGPVVSTDFTSLPPLTAGSSLTAVLINPQDPTTAIADIVTFTDDTTTSTGKAKIRFINVSQNDVVQPNDAGPDANADAGATLIGADFGLGGGILLTNQFTNVTSQERLDPTATNGYREIDPVSGIDSTLTPVSGQTSVEGYLPSTDSLTLPAGAILTAFYSSVRGDGVTPVLVWCYDGVASASSSLLTKCESLISNDGTDSIASFTRFGDFSADGNDRDVCVKYHSSSTYVGPLLQRYGSADAGTEIPAQFLSAYFNLHGGFQFDARFVNGGAADCSTAVAPDTTYTAFTGEGGGYTSVLLTGYASVPSDAGAIPPYDAGGPAVFLDDAGNMIDAGPQPTSDGLTTLATSVVVLEDVPYDADNLPALRLVHLAATHPAPLSATFTGDGVITGPGDDDDVQGAGIRPLATEQWELDNVPYGGFSTRPGPTDPFGYQTMVNGALSIDFESNEWSYTLTDSQTTMFAFDGVDGVQFLACNDYDEVTAPSDVLYTTCCVVGVDGCGNNVIETAPDVLAPSGRRAHERSLIRSLRYRTR